MSEDEDAPLVVVLECIRPSVRPPPRPLTQTLASRWWRRNRVLLENKIILEQFDLI